jgi:glyoxylase-like metal-dependent hydrolase (beta-lactamase superfamily II)
VTFRFRYDPALAEVTMIRIARPIAVTVMFVLMLGATAAAQQQPPRSIVNITGQLYRAQNDNHYTVFLVTPEGVIMSDPINRDFSRWLKSEIASRFKVPVRYVLYTHRDWDHASGGVVFADTAQFVGHINMLAGLAPPEGRPALPSAEAALDSNRNGVIERSEATGNTAIAQRFDLFDYNHDGIVNGAEVARGSVNDVYPPTVTYSSAHEITLGGKRVRLVPLGAAHSDDSVVLHFPDERAVFSADILQVKRLPQGITPTVGAYIDALRTINAIDYDHALTGHAMSGRKQDAMDLQRYLEELATGVAAGVGAGKSLPDIQRTLTLDSFKGFERWDTSRAAHIASVYATLKGSSAQSGTR